MQGAVGFPDDGVEVAVAVEVGEAGRAVVPHIDAVERIGGAGARGEGRRDGRAGVLEIVQVAVDFPDDGVEVAVAVEVGEAGRAVDPTSTPLNGLATPVCSANASGAMAAKPAASVTLSSRLRLAVGASEELA